MRGLATLIIVDGVAALVKPPLTKDQLITLVFSPKDEFALVQILAQARDPLDQRSVFLTALLCFQA